MSTDTPDVQRTSGAGIALAREVERRAPALIERAGLSILNPWPVS